MNKNVPQKMPNGPTDGRYESLRDELNIKHLLQDAQEKSGLSDYGDEGFIKALDKLLDCVARDTNLHAVGLKEFKDEIVRNLINRLRFQSDLKRHPEILDEDVSDPIVIIGLARSGTTKIHRMMGIDPSLLKTYMWQLVNPAPFPNMVSGQMDPRIAAACHGDALAEDQAEVQAGHHMAAEQVEEDWAIFDLTFNDWHGNARTPSRSWHDWVLSRTVPSDLDNYRYVRSLYQYLQWQQGGRNNRRWLMKNTGCFFLIDELLEVFPKATLVHVHRHPRASVPSLAKLLLDVWGMRVADVDPKFVGEFVLEWQKESIHRCMEARDRLGLNDSILDVKYDQIRNDPMPVFREIYRRAGHTLTAATEQEMRQWERENEQGKHGKHVYFLEQFGLSEKIIDDAFGEYIRRFIDS